MYEQNSKTKSFQEMHHPLALCDYIISNITDTTTEQAYNDCTKEKFKAVSEISKEITEFDQDSIHHCLIVLLETGES